MKSNWQDLFQLPASERDRRRIHLVGIGGTGLGPIAKVLLEMGFQVSGSDQSPSPRTKSLRPMGADITIGHEGDNLRRQTDPALPDLVLISSAIPDSNGEVIAAGEADIAVVKREALLGPLTTGRKVIAVAGTHGKTTTTGMIALLLKSGGIDAGYIIGSDIPGLGMSSAGSNEWFVIEADEYDYAFLGLSPHIAVLTSLDWDHPDCFPTREIYEDAFQHFLANLQPDGQIIYCRDDPAVRQLNARSTVTASRHGYGTRNGASYEIGNIEISAAETSYDLTVSPENDVATVRLAIPGLHNVLNSTGALIAAKLAGVDWNKAVSHISDYKGAGRRFEIKGEVGGVLVIDDYAHHPAEIRSTLAAARAAYPDREIWAVYQPHTYSRTRTFLAAYEGVFSAADHLIITDIYAAREAQDANITPESVVASSRHPDGSSIGSLDDVLLYLKQHVGPNSIMIILSAGTATKLGPELLRWLQTSEIATPSA